ncbi:MAG TPA: glycosyltransferase family 39 protein [Thermoanaerobaculia bacterium]
MKKSLVPWLLILAVAAAVRLPALTAGLPYSSYVDENYVLHQVVHLVSDRTWEPTEYFYPPLTLYLIAAAATVYSPVYASGHGHPLQEDFSPFPPQYYDILEPSELIVVGRLVTLAFSLGIVVLTGVLARRLAGRPAGLAAAWLAALVPALVIRGAVVNVNPYVVFFALATFLFAEGAREGDRPRRDAILAGVMVGLATACKYPAGLLCLPVALAVLLSSASWGEKLRRLVLAGAASAAATVAANPPLVLRSGDVLKYMGMQSSFYENIEMGSYWEQAVHRAEWDLPLNHPEVGIVFLILAAAGLILAFRDRRWARALWGWLLFGIATGAVLASYDFRAFRNLLAFVPLACVLIGLLYSTLRQRISRPLWLDLAAAALPVVLFTPALNQYIRHQLALVDSREQAIHWLAGHVGPRDKVLVAEEVAFLPSRVASLGSRTDVQSWGRAKRRIYSRRYHYLVLGMPTNPRGGLKIGKTATDEILEDYSLVAGFGSDITHSHGANFRGNQQQVYVLKRKPRPDRVREPAAPPRRGAARRSAAP